MNNQQPNPQGQRQIQIKIKDDVLAGAYANAARVSHTKEEFILDFMNLFPQEGAGVVNGRIITSPGHFKRIIAAMQDNLRKYEERFGKIEMAQGGNEEIGFKV